MLKLSIMFHRFSMWAIFLGKALLHTGAKGDWDFLISDLLKNPNGTGI